MVERPKTDGSSLVRSENTAGGNGPSIEPSHGRFVAFHKINFHIKPEKGGRLKRGTCIFLQFGVKIWGGRLIRAIDLYTIIYSNITAHTFIFF